MQTHSQTHNRPGSRTRVPSSVAGGVLDAWRALVGAADRLAVPPRRGRNPRGPVTDLLPALIFHVMQGPGTLADHCVELFGAPVADSSWADRRARLPWEICTDLMRRAWRPRAPRRPRDAFWRGWRLVALDGTPFSLTNTPQITATVTKAKTRRGRAAFATLTTAVLLEIGLHNPLAAGIGRRGQSAWALALRLLAPLPKGALLLGDRLYGCAACAVHAVAACARVGSHVLLRARASVKPHVVTRLADGSRVIRVAGRAPRNPTRIVEWLEVLKRHLRTTDVLQSHTVDTAAQEIAALIVASALLATERARAAPSDVPVVRVSFATVLYVVRSMWLFFGPCEDLITDRQQPQIVRRGYALMARGLTRQRRSRSVPRAVRQAVNKWLRLLRAESVEGPLHFHVM